jgi:hypothetical protein
MSGYQRITRANVIIHHGVPQTPVVPRERVAPRKQTVQERESAFIADLSNRFPVTKTGRRSDWIDIAKRYRRHRFMSLTTIGEPFSRDHTYVLHALRTMGIYEDRNTPKWKVKFARHLRESARKRKGDNARSEIRAEERRKLIVAEGTLAPFNAKITQKEAKIIRTLFDDGMERKKIARLFKVSPGLVYRIGKREKWKDLN